MRWRLVVRRNRVRPALVFGVATALALSVFAPLPGVAETILEFRDEFQNVSYSGNDGTHNWSWWWTESGESTDSSDGSISSARCVAARALGKFSSGGSPEPWVSSM